MTSIAHDDDERSMKRRLPLVAAIAVPLIAGTIAYANVFGGAFLLDDTIEIISNPAMRTLWPPWVPMFGGHQVAARPLPYLSFAIDHAIWGLRPAGFHLTNLLVHLATAAGLVALTRDTLRQPSLPAVVRGRATMLASLAATLWVVHPLTTAAVTYTYQRIEALASLFIVLSLAAAVRVFAIPVGDDTRAVSRRRWQAASCMAACLAAASKETAVAIPPLVAAYWWVFSGARPGERCRDRLAFFGMLAAAWIVLAAVLTAGRSDYAELKEAIHPPLHYAWTQAGVLLHYARLVIWPTGLCIDHDWPLATGPAAVAGPLVAVGGVLAATLVGFVRRAPAAYPFLAAFLLLAPTSSILPLADLVFEHRMYLPSFCLVAWAVVPLGWAVLTAARRLPARWSLVVRGAALAAACLAAVLAARETRGRNAAFADVDRLWEAVLDRYPDSVRANWFVACIRAKQGDVEAALALAERSTRRRPGGLAFQHVQQVFRDAGDLAAWERTCRVGLAALEAAGQRESPGWFDVGFGLAESLRQQGRVAEAAAFVGPLADRAAEVLGATHAVTASLAIARLRCDMAGPAGPGASLERARSLAARLAPALGADHVNTLDARTILAVCLAETGYADEAESHLCDVIRIERTRPVLAPARLTAALETYASFLESQGRMAEAGEVRRFRQATDPRGRLATPRPAAETGSPPGS
jgi:hypothetical protein